MRALTLALLLFAACASQPPPPHAFDALIGRAGVVTLVTLHPDEPRSRLFSVNYQQQGILPVCTPVTLLERSPKRLLCQATPTNLSLSRVAKRRDRCSWRFSRMLTANWPDSLIAVWVVSEFSMQIRINGGLSESEANELTVIPYRCPSCTTGVLQWFATGWFPVDLQISVATIAPPFRSIRTAPAPTP